MSGYFLLVVLAISGCITIYLEILKSLKISEYPDTKQELVRLNNTLATMYQAEGTIGLLSIAENKNLKQEYDSLMHKVSGQIDSMKTISKNPDMHANLDSLSILMKKKHKNVSELVSLMNSIESNAVKEITQTTISTWNDLKALDDILVNRVQTNEDTTIILSEKKGFFKRIKDAVKSQPEKLTQVKKGSVSQQDELDAPLMSDTIVKLEQEINQIARKKNAEIIRKLIVRQNELYRINEQTSLRIQQIMENIKVIEFQSNMDELNAKNELQKQSTNYVAGIALVALIVAIFFMTWTLKSLNESQKLHKNIREAKNHVEKLLRFREQLIYTITHDIKAPIGSIMGFLDLMSEDEPSKKQQYYINNMNSSASHIIDLVRNLLDFQSIEKNRPQFNDATFSPFTLLNDIYESFLPLSEKKKIKFDLNTEIQEEDKYMSDPYRIRQILNNLISNALKFTPENGTVLVSASVEDKNVLQVSVKDNGPGIAELDKTRIFEEFIRLKKTKSEIDGVGLGLTISKKLALLLGGNIEIRSQLGQGSEFILSLPLTPEEMSSGPGLEKGNTYILFVDDDIVQLNLLSELMKKEKLPFRCCASAHEALEILQKEPFDIIFTDIQIPDLNGYELAEQIRKLPFPGATSIPIIGFSADRRTIEGNRKSKFSGFLSKPFKIEELLKSIEKYTGNKVQSDTKYPAQSGFNLNYFMKFMPDDRESALNILDSFIEETGKNLEVLKNAFDTDNWDEVKKLSHKMSSLMKMISANEIVSLLNDFEKGSRIKEKKVTLLRLIDEKIKEAEETRKMLKE
jgi:signal transduction histidine kinase/DNA-binding response OmpR family regulator